MPVVLRFRLFGTLRKQNQHKRISMKTENIYPCKNWKEWYTRTCRDWNETTRKNEFILNSSNTQPVKYLTYYFLSFRYFIMLFALPVLQCCNFNWVYGTLPENLHLAVVNDEISLKNCNSSSLFGCFLDERSDLFLSCLFLDIMQNKTYKIVSDLSYTLSTSYLFWENYGDQKIWTLKEICTVWIR